MDFDELLNFEQQCYDQGYKEGLKKGKIQGHTEGRELGVQTGFQRYLSMGILQARSQIWHRESESEQEKTAVKNLQSMVATPELTNDPQVVEDIDRRIRLAKNKCRTLAASRQSPKVEVYEQRIMYRRDADDTTAIEDMY